MLGEEAHEAGRSGVGDVKRWLEATMRFEVRYTVYDQAARVTVPLLSGGTKRFDMLAQHFEADAAHTPSGRDVYVEVKNVHALSTAKAQVGQYKKFVAIAVSATEASASALAATQSGTSCGQRITLGRLIDFSNLRVQRSFKRRAPKTKRSSGIMKYLTSLRLKSQRACGSG
jgi:hypothetical protein